MEKPSVAFDPLPSSVPLQGKKGFSRSSSELSSSKGVWLSRKWKENERQGEKMKQKAGELKASPAKNLLRSDFQLQGLIEAYIRSEPREITKETKTKSY